MGFSWLLDWGQICWVRNFCQRHGVLQASHEHQWKSDPFRKATIVSDSLWTNLSNERIWIGDFDYLGTRSRVFSWKSCFSTCLFYPWGQLALQSRPWLPVASPMLSSCSSCQLGAVKSPTGCHSRNQEIHRQVHPFGGTRLRWGSIWLS